MEDKEQTLYEILNVPQNATLEEIKIAYRKRAMEYHPDTNPNANNEFCHKMMCKINEAYSILRNPDLRKIYDERLLEEGKYDIHNEENTSSQQTTGNKERAKTCKETYKPNSEQYNYYNTVDFDEYTQEEFIEWIEIFSYEYIILTFDYYKKLNNDSDSILEKLYNSFDNIINYEKELSKKEEKLYRL